MSALPLLSRANLVMYSYGGVALANHGYALVARGDKQCVDILREEDVIATAQHIPTLGLVLRKDFGQLLGVVELHEMFCCLSNMERIALRDVDILVVAYHNL